jgi:hypothetical protein
LENDDYDDKVDLSKINYKDGHMIQPTQNKSQTCTLERGASHGNTAHNSMELIYFCCDTASPKFRTMLQPLTYYRKTTIGHTLDPIRELSGITAVKPTDISLLSISDDVYTSAAAEPGQYTNLHVERYDGVTGWICRTSRLKGVKSEGFGLECENMSTFGRRFSVGMKGSCMSRTTFDPTTPDRSMPIFLTHLTSVYRVQTYVLPILIASSQH